MWRAGAGEVEVALVHRPRYDDWSVPKGKLEPLESTRVAAVREVGEETGARVALGRFLARTHYRVGADHKKVEYFAARYLSGELRPSHEVDEMRWLPVSAARAALSYDRDREVLDAFTALPQDLTTVLLVRHAKAGSKSEWDHEDDLRPLSKNGRKQLAPVRVLGTLYGAERVYSAPLVRCVATVQPVADDLGVPIAEEKLLSEKAYPGREETAVDRVAEIASAGGTAVICSQGGVIPDLVARLATRSGLSLGRHLAAKKGSVWALFFDGTRLAAADYLAVP